MMYLASGSPSQQWSELFHHNPGGAVFVIVLIVAVVGTGALLSRKKRSSR